MCRLKEFKAKSERSHGGREGSSTFVEMEKDVWFICLHGQLLLIWLMQKLPSKGTQWIELSTHRISLKYSLICRESMRMWWQAVMEKAPGIWTPPIQNLYNTGECQTSLKDPNNPEENEKEQDKYEKTKK